MTTPESLGITPDHGGWFTEYLEARAAKRAAEIYVEWRCRSCGCLIQDEHAPSCRFAPQSPS